MGDTYDANLGWDEWVLGIRWLRSSLVSQASGKVRTLSACSHDDRGNRIKADKLSNLLV